ncbi:MAG: YceH family protein, partial [Terracidiphilus sp.]
MTPSEPIQLTAPEARVLGALVEKEVTTPEYYPLSLNALVNACNQRSNREPVTDLDEEAVRQALHGLEDLRLAGRARSSDGRVTKYEHWLGEAFNLNRAQTALLCVLLLRGPQTPGELRGRAERMHRFDEIGEVLAGLQKLMEREPPLAAILPRQPGTKESRYAHLLSGSIESVAASFAAEPTYARRETGQFAEQDAA